jgi:ubiquinone/menaquinone biosynthesis C-methylase UbiE
VIPAKDSSVQLITASQAAHWFNLPKFYAEGQRVLSPSGVLALYGYEFPKFRWNQDPEKNKVLDKLLLEVLPNKKYYILTTTL